MYFIGSPFGRNLPQGQGSLRPIFLPTFTGCFLGLLAGLALMFVCHLKFNHLPVWDIVVFTVLPVSAVTAALMLLFGSLAVRKPVRDLLSRSLAASLSEIE